SLRLADRLVKGHRSDLAEREILRCLDAWGDDPKAKTLLTIPVRHYTITSVEPERFSKEVWPSLKRLEKHSGLHSGVRDIRKPFEEDFAPSIQAPQKGSVQPFPEWSQLEADSPKGEKVFPKLLNSIGNYYYGSADRNGQARNPRSALARYAV